MIVKSIIIHKKSFKGLRYIWSQNFKHLSSLKQKFKIIWMLIKQHILKKEHNIRYYKSVKFGMSIIDFFA